MFGQFANPFFTKFFKEKGTILAFLLHGVYRTKEEKEYSYADPQDNMTLDELRKVIEYFLNLGYVFISSEDLNSNLVRNKKYIMLTFDDGYFNNSFTLPLLNEFKIPATYYISTYNLTEQKSFWWDIIYRERLRQKLPLTTIRKEQQSLKNLQYSYIETYLTDHFGSSSLIPMNDMDRPFTSKELVDFSRQKYVTIGNHSHHHALLPTYDLPGILNELTISQQIFYRLLGFYPSTIAYPNGSYNKEVIEATKNMGFKTGITVNQTKNYIPAFLQNPLVINRFILKNPDIRQSGHIYRRDIQLHNRYKKMKRQLKHLLHII
jgi:peptidoglycan/xylan/chitin deacetylase (PgdA/CDA1 family)